MADRALSQGSLTFEVLDPNATTSDTNVIDIWDPGTGSSRANYLGFITPATLAGVCTVQTSVDEAFTNPVTLNDEADADFNLEADKATMVPFPITFRYIRIHSAGVESSNTATLNEAVGSTPDAAIAVMAEDAGHTAAATFDGTLVNVPVVPSSVTTIQVGLQAYADDGMGALTDGALGTGTIDYETGEFSLAGLDLANQDDDVLVDYSYENPDVATFTGELDDNPILPETVEISVGDAAPEVYTDDGEGILTSTAGGTGTINYATGAIVLNGIAAANQDGEAIVADYVQDEDGAVAITYYRVTA
jgi:Flp pilus assembly pilin Flp